MTMDDKSYASEMYLVTPQDFSLLQSVKSKQSSEIEPEIESSPQSATPPQPSHPQQPPPLSQSTTSSSHQLPSTDENPHYGSGQKVSEGDIMKYYHNLTKDKNILKNIKDRQWSELYNRLQPLMLMNKNLYQPEHQQQQPQQQQHQQQQQQQLLSSTGQQHLSRRDLENSLLSSLPSSIRNSPTRNDYFSDTWGLNQAYPDEKSESEMTSSDYLDLPYLPQETSVKSIVPPQQSTLNKTSEIPNKTSEVLKFIEKERIDGLVDKLIKDATAYDQAYSQASFKPPSVRSKKRGREVTIIENPSPQGPSQSTRHAKQMRRLTKKEAKENAEKWNKTDPDMEKIREKIRNTSREWRWKDY